MGFSFIASLLDGILPTGSKSYAMDSVRLFLLGSLLEAGRRFLQWLVGRFRLRSYPPSFVIFRNAS